MNDYHIHHRIIEQQYHLPTIGQRILKSALAVLICLLINLFRDAQGIPFYSAIATILCMQPYVGNSFKVALDRIWGTVIGAIYGCLILLLELNLLPGTSQPVHYIIVSFTIIFVIYTTVLLKQKSSSYIACVAFLSITVTTTVELSPFVFALERVVDTLIGIIVALLVNTLRIPRRKNKDILFISALDETLVTPNNTLTDYSKVVLNQMIQEGMNFTVSTTRTPASLMVPMTDVHLKLPVIAANGALLYDLNKRHYVKKTEMPYRMAKATIEYLQNRGFHCFTTAVVEDVLLIYYGVFNNEAEQLLYEEMKLSPYRNYIKLDLPVARNVIYIMVLEKDETVENLKEELRRQSFTSEIYIFTQPSEYEGFSYLKIYDKNVSRRQMMEYLKETRNAKKLITFGSVEGFYDYVVSDNDTNTVIKKLKNLYEPYFWHKK